MMVRGSTAEVGYASLPRAHSFRAIVNTKVKHGELALVLVIVIEYAV